MSSHFVRLIPLDIDFVPNDRAERASVSLAAELGFNGGVCETYDEVTFIDGGENFPRKLPCQHCGFDLVGEDLYWSAAMSNAYGARPQFSNLKFSCPQCDGTLSLYDLSLREPSHGFARWVLEWPATGQVVRAIDVASLSSAIGSAVRVIYVHI